MSKRRNQRRQQPPIELVLLPDEVTTSNVSSYLPQANNATQAQLTPAQHMASLARRISIQGQHIIPGAPLGIRKVKVPSGFDGDGGILWRDL